MTKLIAPPLRELRVVKLAANYAEIQWDRIGANFRYEVQLSGGAAADSMGPWRRVDYTQETFYFFDDNQIQRDTYYRMRVRAVYKDFEPGLWTETDTVLSFSTNSYAFATQQNFELSKPFIGNFFTLNDKSYLDTENDALYATLVRPGFDFDKNVEFYTEEGASFVRNNGFQVVYEQVPIVCKSQERVIPAVIDDVIYAFERFQGIAKVSNDGGQNWHVYNALNGRAGNPVSNCIAQQNKTNTFVLGWDYMYQGIPSLDLTFDNDREHWSSVEFTFENLDIENEFGFETERFTPLAPIPATLRGMAEAFAVDDYQMIVAGEDKLYEYIIRNPGIQSGGVDDGSRIFDPLEHRITGADDAVIKKIEFFKDPLIGVDLGTFYFLVPGIWIRNTDIADPEFNKKLGIDDTSAVRGIYRMDRTAVIVTNPDYDPILPTTPENPLTIITGFTIAGFTKVYGITAEERVRMTNETTLSRDEGQLIIGVELQKWDVVADTRPPEGTTAVRYYKEQIFTSRQKRLTQAIGTTTGEAGSWAHRVQDYYGSAQFNWMARSGTRDFKDWQNNVVYIRPLTTFTVPFSDLASERWSYEFEQGKHRFNAPNLTITEFSGYSDGALIHNQAGRMIGYYKFAYRIDSPATITWVPEIHMLTATLSDFKPQIIQQEIDAIDYKIDPEISPLLNKMVPETYIPEDNLYKKFAEYYLQFISKGSENSYNKMYNLMASKYARDKHNEDYINKEIHARNQILDPQTRKDVTQFFLSHAPDFYSTKGIINSYKFLFKLLYNEDVDIEVESLNRFEYFIDVTSNDMTEDMVGRRIFTTSGSADITYFERVYNKGIMHYKLTLNNLIGQFNPGQLVNSQWDVNFVAMVANGVQGDATNYNSQDYKDRSKSYYVMKIRSKIQASQYSDDVVRYIHPVGFNFIGITLITVLINQGLSISHNETIVDLFNSMRFDMGGAQRYPEMLPILDAEDQLQYDSQGKLREVAHPLGGQAIPVVEAEYNALFNNDMALGTLPFDRRGEITPRFDASWVRWSELITKLTGRLKDNIGNPYDPVATQRNIEDV